MFILECLAIPIGSMYGIYANIWGILMGSMLPYVAYMECLAILQSHSRLDQTFSDVPPGASADFDL